MDDVHRLRADLAALTDELSRVRARLDAVASRHGPAGPVASKALDAWAHGHARASRSRRPTAATDPARRSATASGAPTLTVVATPPEPGMNSDERTTLVEFLDHFRGVFVGKVAGLTDAQARTAAVEPSDLTLLGLLGHAAYVERFWFRVVFHGEDIDLIYDFTDDPDADLHPGPEVTLAGTMAQWRNEVAEARAIVEQTVSLDTIASRQRHGQTVNLRWILVHMIEEYARHCGHADLLRQRIDGRVGV